MRLIDAEALKKEFEKIYPLATNEMGGVVNKKIYDIIDNAPTVPLPDFKDGYKQAIIDGKTNFSRPQGEWIPVKYRYLTVKECIAFAEHYGIEYSDTVDEKAFVCPLPENGQEILIPTSWGVSTDVADNDIDGEGFICYGLEGNGDWDGIDAWMPLPKPYEKGGEEG